MFLPAAFAIILIASLHSTLPMIPAMAISLSARTPRTGSLVGRVVHARIMAGNYGHCIAIKQEKIQMSELFRTRCKQGQLVITEDVISVELGQLKSETLMRANFTGVDSKVAVFPILGMGGGTNLVFHG